MDKPVIYLPISEPNIIIEGCKTLVKGVLERLIEKQINGTAEYTSDSRNIIKIKIIKIELVFE